MQHIVRPFFGMSSYVDVQIAREILKVLSAVNCGSQRECTTTFARPSYTKEFIPSAKSVVPMVKTMSGRCLPR